MSGSSSKRLRVNGFSSFVEDTINPRFKTFITELEPMLEDFIQEKVEEKVAAMREETQKVRHENSELRQKLSAYEGGSDFGGFSQVPSKESRKERLLGMKVSELKKIAREGGVSAEAVDATDDADDTKEAIIELVLKREYDDGE